MTVKQRYRFSENELINLEKLCADFDIKAGISNSFKEIISLNRFITRHSLHWNSVRKQIIKSG